MSHPHTPGEAWLPKVTSATRDGLTASMNEGGDEFIAAAMLQLQQEQPELVQMANVIADINTAQDDCPEFFKVRITLAIMYAALKSQIESGQLGQIPTAES